MDVIGLAVEVDMWSCFHPAPLVCLNNEVIRAHCHENRGLAGALVDQVMWRVPRHSGATVTDNRIQVNSCLSES
jgi:hypothetical protein